MAVAGRVRTWAGQAGRAIQGLAPLEARLQSAGPWLWCAVAAAVVGYCGLPLSDHPDTLRDLLAARDCVDRGDCAAEGAASSLAGLHNGALWPFLLVLLRSMQVPTPAIAWCVLACDAAAVALIYAAVQRHRPQASAWAAVLAVAVLAVERTPNTVWSPALGPWLTALAIAWWLHWQSDPPPRPWGPLVHGALLALLADSHPATWPCVAAWLVAVLVTDTRPLAALAWLGVGFLAATGLLAPQTQFENLRPAWETVPPLAAVCAVLAVALASRRLLRSWRSVPLLGLCIVSALSACGLLVGTVLLDRPLEPRYLTASLLVGVAAVTLAPWPAHRAPTALPALIAAALFAGLHGPGRVSVGHPWPVVVQVQNALQVAGLAYPLSAARIQGYGCRRLAGAVEVDAPGHPWQLQAPSPLGVQVLDLPSDQPQPPGWQAAAVRADLTTWWRMVPLWVDASRGEACLDGPNGRTCTTITPGLWLSPSSQPTVRPGAPLHTRAMPESFQLPVDPTATAQVTLSLQVHSGGDTDRTVFLLDNDPNCPWTITRTAHPGAQLSNDRRSVTLPALGTQTTLELGKAIGRRCSGWAGTTANPPCLLELEAPAPRPEVP